MNRRLLLFCLLLGECAPAVAQRERAVWQVRVQRPYSLTYGREFDPAWGTGWGIQAERRQAFRDGRTGWLVGLEVSQAGWGNQALVKGGVARRVFEAGRWSGDVRAYAMPGVALFRPRLLGAYRVGIEGVLAYRVGKRLHLAAGFGLAHEACPAYGRYSPVKKFTGLPLFLGIQW